MSASRPPVTIRLARAEDRAALSVLAHLDSSPPLSGRCLVAEVDGGIRAAAAVDGRRTIADPFSRCSELVELLELRAAQLRAQSPRGAKTRLADSSGGRGRHDPSPRAAARGRARPPPDRPRLGARPPLAGPRACLRARRPDARARRGQGQAPAALLLRRPRRSQPPRHQRELDGAPEWARPRGAAPGCSSGPAPPWRPSSAASSSASSPNRGSAPTRACCSSAPTPWAPGSIAPRQRGGWWLRAAREVGDAAARPARHRRNRERDQG